MTAATIKRVDHSFVFEGDLTVDTVGYLRKFAIKQMADQKEAIFDLSEIADTDSSALALFLALIRYANSVSKTIRFRNIPEHLLAVAQLCGIKDALPQ